MSSHDAHLDALIRRQGKGARYDASNAPAEDLLLARRGTAFLARQLTECSDSALYAPSRREGQTRAYVIAEICAHARQQANLLDDLREGRVPKVASEVPDLDLAATLPARALRHLFEHSAVHLNVVWRDLHDADWDKLVAGVDGHAVLARMLPRIHAKRIWRGALDLGVDAQIRDIPRQIVETLNL